MKSRKAGLCMIVALFVALFALVGYAGIGVFLLVGLILAIVKIAVILIEEFPDAPISWHVVKKAFFFKPFF